MWFPRPAVWLAHDKSSTLYIIITISVRHEIWSILWHNIIIKPQTRSAPLLIFPPKTHTPNHLCFSHIISSTLHLAYTVYGRIYLAPAQLHDISTSAGDESVLAGRKGVTEFVFVFFILILYCTYIYF